MRKKKPLVIPNIWDQVAAEVRAVVDRHGAQRNLAILASLVLGNHRSLRGADKDFHLCCAFRALRKEVSDQLNRRPYRKPTTVEFEFLKNSYNVEREGMQLNLELEALTFDEIISKATEYRTLGNSLLAEADELQRFVFLKFPDDAQKFISGSDPDPTASAGMNGE